MVRGSCGRAGPNFQSNVQLGYNCSQSWHLCGPAGRFQLRLVATHHLEIRQCSGEHCRLDDGEYDPSPTYNHYYQCTTGSYNYNDPSAADYHDHNHQCTTGIHNYNYNDSDA